MMNYQVSHLCILDIATLPSGGMRSIAISMSICMSVCLSARMSQKLNVQTSQKFLYVLGIVP